MLATFLIAFHSRRIDNLNQTIRFLEKNHADVVSQSEILFLCQDACGVVDNSFAASQMLNLRYPRMQKCRALNHGAAIAQSDIIVVLDSDRILPPHYFSSVISSLKKGTAVTTKTMRCLTKPSHDEDIVRERYNFRTEHRSQSNDPYTRNLFAGNVVLHKDDYWKSGGMDDGYEGYGFEDSDMANRLKRAGIRGIFRDEVEIHLYHEPMSYGDGDQKKLFLSNGLRFCKNWGLPVPTPLQIEIDEFMRQYL